MVVYAVCLRYLNNVHIYPADMPLPVVRSPLGLPLGDRGLLPLPDALSAVGAGVVAGGPYTLPILKGCLVPLLGCPAGRVPVGGHSNTTLLQFTSHLRILLSISRTHGRLWTGTCKGGMASNRSTSGATPPIPGGLWGPPRPSKRVPPCIGHDPQAWEGSARHRAPPTSAR